MSICTVRIRLETVSILEAKVHADFVDRLKIEKRRRSLANFVIAEYAVNFILI